jgi:hypothetical protein
VTAFGWDQLSHGAGTVFGATDPHTQMFQQSGRDCGVDRPLP